MSPFDPMQFLPSVIVYPEDVKLESRQVGENKRTIRQQWAWLQVPGVRHPKQFKFSLGDEQVSPYPAGEYLIDPSSYRLGSFDSLELNPYGIKLVHVPEQLRALKKGA